MDKRNRWSSDGWFGTTEIDRKAQKNGIKGTEVIGDMAYVSDCPNQYSSSATANGNLTVLSLDFCPIYGNELSVN